jgi:hypothetical protein
VVSPFAERGEQLEEQMSEIETEVGPVIGHLQADTFCQGCGYNLHTQAVMRDARLGILVCRCPECGRFAPAGLATTAARVWLNRLILLLLVFWMLFIVALFALCTTFLGIAAYGHVMNNVRFSQVGVPKAPGRSVYVYAIYTPQPADKDAAERQLYEQVAMALLAVALGTITGGLFSVVLWHLKSSWRALAWIPPLLGCGIAAVAWVNDPWAVLIWRWGLCWIVAYYFLESAAVGAGLLLGRPIARGLLRILLPPAPRQHLAFLWTVDGKRIITSSAGEK